MKNLVKFVGRKSLVFAKGAMIPIVVPEVRNSIVRGFVTSAVQGLAFMGATFGVFALIVDAKGETLSDVFEKED